jgi:hypothetical protein
MTHLITIEDDYHCVEFNIDVSAIYHKAYPPCYHSPNGGYPGEPEWFEICDWHVFSVQVRIGNHWCPIEVPAETMPQIINDLIEAHYPSVAQQLHDSMFGYIDKDD